MTSRARGFTLIETVIAIAITFIVVGIMALFVTGPVDAFFAQSRRAALNDAVDGVWRHMSRDIRAALPNSIRRINVGGVEALEMLEALDSARYRPQLLVGSVPNDELYFDVGDQFFATAGRFRTIGPGFDRADRHIAINNLGVPGFDAYAFNNVMTPPQRIRLQASGIAGEDRVLLDALMTFSPGPGSPTRRMYLVSGPITYLCNPVAGTIIRYSGYAIDAAQANRASHAALVGAGAIGTPVASDISACTFRVTPGATPVATIQLSASRQNEVVTTLYQAHSENPP
jgi:MSHA biogenesis protein MshO